LHGDQKIIKNKKNKNCDEEYYEVGDFVPNTQNTPVEKVPKNRLIFVHIYFD
jgi:hypothetical protein